MPVVVGVAGEDTYSENELDRVEERYPQLVSVFVSAKPFSKNCSGVTHLYGYKVLGNDERCW